MRSTDRWVGFALALLALAVIQSARSFPAVPGQKLGAAFLPMLVGAGLLVCGVVLVLRSLRSRGDTGASESAVAQRGAEHYG
ncbi:MAG: tripartite tricarboxylate transporter TctB family protein, partial [Burkholderiaceae bacterium]